MVYIISGDFKAETKGRAVADLGCAGGVCAGMGSGHEKYLISK